MGALFDILKAIYETISTISDYVTLMLNNALELLELVSEIPIFLDAFNTLLFTGVAGAGLWILFQVTIALRILGRA